MIEAIATHLASLRYEDLSPAAREKLKLCVLANLAVGIAGVSYTYPPEPRAEGGRFGLLSRRRAAGAREAAFWNAAAMHARTQDDFDPVGNLHVGTVVLPALLAMADSIPLTGRTFLRATLAGYVAAVGLARYASPRTSPRGLRSTGFFSPFIPGAATSSEPSSRTRSYFTALLPSTVPPPTSARPRRGP